MILTVPDAPVNFRNIVATTHATQISLVWEDGFSNGGAPVQSYKVTFDQGADTWQLLIDGLTQPTYTVTGLSTGTNYSFKVQSINAFGTSAESELLVVLAA